MQQETKFGIWLVVGIAFFIWFCAFGIPALFMLQDAWIRWLHAALKV